MQETQTEKKKKKKAEGRFSSELFGWGESPMAVLIFFVVVFTFFVRLIARGPQHHAGEQPEL